MLFHTQLELFFIGSAWVTQGLALKVGRASRRGERKWSHDSNLRNVMITWAYNLTI